MKIEKVNDNQIRCTLTKSDLIERQIKISELAYGTEKAKSLFRDMMQQASYEYGFEAEDIPLMIEAKSAGDYTNTNKRRKEEAQKINQLRSTLGETVRFVLFLCGYFDTHYLGYEAGEGIDWVWGHRIDDLAQFGI